jgi:hypothetical protein
MDLGRKKPCAKAIMREAAPFPSLPFSVPRSDRSRFVAFVDLSLRFSPFDFSLASPPPSSLFGRSPAPLDFRFEFFSVARVASDRKRKDPSPALGHVHHGGRIKRGRIAFDS